MNHHDDPSSDQRDDILQARLRALPRQMTPPAEGWARLQAVLPPREPTLAQPMPGQPLSAFPARRRRLRWALPTGAALAASLALYWVAPLPLQLPANAPAAPSVLQQQASAMTDDYRQAIAALPQVDAPEWRPALVELDDSVDQIRDALAQSPRSRHLLDQLQRTYALRLELTRQAAMSATGLPS